MCTFTILLHMSLHIFLHDFSVHVCIQQHIMFLIGEACLCVLFVHMHKCLQAALRRLAAGCPDSIEAADHQQLIKPRLVDSFLLCSNMEESFVWWPVYWRLMVESWTRVQDHDVYCFLTQRGLMGSVTPKHCIYFLTGALVCHFLCPGMIFLSRFHPGHHWVNGVKLQCT